MRHSAQWLDSRFRGNDIHLFNKALVEAMETDPLQEMLMNGRGMRIKLKSVSICEFFK
ncbi:hypothetical protein Lche_0710 [Legionella cherrii]|uniref:Uncharacterized protein n=1 Tax=Legionella cherrii TaxID=28084 RepID=A0A0W0SG60_9GAMM|nr:hypothetical protein Lche_0710 [Legionella cherrii]